MRLQGIKGREDEDAPVVVLTTSETATSGVLAVLSYTTVTGRDVATAIEIVSIVLPISQTQRFPKSIITQIRRAKCQMP